MLTLFSDRNKFNTVLGDRTLLFEMAYSSVVRAGDS